MGGKVSSLSDEDFNALLERLEVSVVKLSELVDESKGIRMDSEFYQKKFLSILKNNQLNLKPLGDFVKHGYRVVYENTKILKSEEAVENNYPIFLQATDVATPFIKTDNLFYVHENDWIRYEKGRVEKGELLIEVKGKIEKVAIVPDNFPNKVLVSGSLYKLTVNENINKHYLLCYLISEYGQSFKNRYSSNLLIAFLSKFDLYKIPVPVFSKELQDKIEIIFKQSYQAKATSQNLYATAEAKLLTALGLSDYQPSTENVQVKSLKDSFLNSGRLDAEYYQPKYEEVEQLIRNTGSFNALGSITTFIQRGKQPKYHTEGLTVINSRHVRQDKIIVDNNRKATVQHNSTVIRKNDLLINGTGVGTIGRSAVYLYDFDALPDNHVTVVKTIELDAVFLSLFLNSIAGQLQVDKYFKGSSGQIELYPDDIKKFLVWIAPEDFQQFIREQIEKSHQLKTQSKQLLHIAKTGVEKAIESSEAEAIVWMEAEINSLNEAT